METRRGVWPVSDNAVRAHRPRGPPPETFVQHTYQWLHGSHVTLMNQNGAADAPTSTAPGKSTRPVKRF